jgi:hypothetical protein
MEEDNNDIATEVGPATNSLPGVVQTDPDNTETTRSRTSINIENLVLGKQYDILDSSHRWCEGEVLCIFHSSTTLAVLSEFANFLVIFRLRR